MNRMGWCKKRNAVLTLVFMAVVFCCNMAGALQRQLEKEAVSNPVIPDSAVYVGIGEAVMMVDPSTGERQLIAGSTRGGGIDLNYGGFDLEDGENLVAVTYSDGVKIVHVDRLTGDREILPGLGDYFVEAVVIRRETAGTYVILDQVRGVVRLDPGDGSHDVLMTGYIMGLFVNDLDFEADGDLVMAGPGYGVIRVNAPGGGRITIADYETGSGEPVGSPKNVAVLPDGDYAFTNGSSNVLRVNPDTGVRTILSGSGTGTGQNFSDPDCLRVNSDGKLIVWDIGLEAVFEVDPSSGNRRVISSSTLGVGTGPDLFKDLTGFHSRFMAVDLEQRPTGVRRDSWLFYE